METWKPITGYEGLYEVSSFGKVRSLINRKEGDPRMIKTHTDARGYVQVALTKFGKHKSFWVHRLVALEFIPNPKNRREVNHIDGNKSNVAAANLEWVSRSQNMRHAYEQGLIPAFKPGSRNHNAKLTDEQVRQIRAEYEEREIMQRELAAKYGISISSLHNILKRKSYTHI